MIEIWGRPGCGYCVAAKALCVERGFAYKYYQLDDHFTRQELLETFPTAKTYPQIKVDGHSIGGYTDLLRYVEDTGYTGTGSTL